MTFDGRQAAAVLLGGCNRHHIAPVDTRGTLCGLYGPAAPQSPTAADHVCKSCLRIMKVRVPRSRSTFPPLPRPSGLAQAGASGDGQAQPLAGIVTSRDGAGIVGSTTERQ